MTFFTKVSSHQMLHTPLFLPNKWKLFPSSNQPKVHIGTQVLQQCFYSFKRPEEIKGRVQIHFPQPVFKYSSVGLNTLLKPKEQLPLISSQKNHFSTESHQKNEESSKEENKKKDNDGSTHSQILEHLLKNGKYREAIGYSLLVAPPLLFFMVALQVYDKIKEWEDKKSKSAIYDAFKDLNTTKQLHKEMEHLKLLLTNAEKLVNDPSQVQKFKEIVQELKSLLGGNDIESHIHNLIKHTEETHQARSKEMLNKHEIEKQKLKTELLEEKEAAIEKMREQSGNHAIENDHLRTKLDLYRKCPEQDCKCTQDLNSFFEAKGTLTYTASHSFSAFFPRILEEALSKNLNPSVSALSFYGTYVKSDNGITHLMEGLKNNKKILSLNLGWTNVGKGDPGKKEINAICDMLRTNQVLEELNLQNNYIDAEDVQKIQEALLENKNTKLKKLNLARTSLKSEEIEQLRDSLKHLKIKVIA